MSSILPNATHITEFVPDSDGVTPVSPDGKWHGTCGETSLMVAIGAAQGIHIKPGDIDYITHDMIKHGLASANGASTIASLAAYTRSRSDWPQPIYEHDYAGDNWDINEWHALLLQYAGIHPIVLNVARGGNLRDVETGSADEAGVQYHVICIFGRQGDGYIVNDGDNVQSNTNFEVYNLATLKAALPCGMLVINGPSSAPSPTPTTSIPLPKGWADDGKNTLTAPNGTTIHDGFRLWCLAHTDKLAEWGNPVIAPYATGDVSGDKQHGPGAECIFERGGLGWTIKENVFELWLGTMIQAARSRLTTANSQITDLQTQLTALQASEDKVTAFLSAFNALQK